VREDAYAYVLKPLDPAMLLATVGRALTQVRLRRRAIGLERRTRIAEKLAAVGTLAAGLAHEIRNPLNAASLQLQLLERRLVRRANALDAPGELLEPVRVVQSEIARLSHLVEDFLAFSRPVDLFSARLDLRDLAREVVQLEGPDAAARGIVLRAELPEEPVLIDGDREKLLQVALNLVRNALEAIPGGGNVVIGARALPQAARLVIRDDGPGIPAELLSRIFEPFFSTKPQGTGLGMPISHNIVAQHQGDMAVESSAAGTTVTLEFPRA
jgi:signal transduction histidine kinase